MLDFFSALLFAATLTGVVRDAATHAPIAAVRVEDLRTHTTTMTDDSGRFRLADPSSMPVRLRFSRDGYVPMEREITTDAGLVIEMTALGRSLERVTVTALRAQETAPVTAKVVPVEDIATRSFGQETPLLLANTPSFTSYAEQGGYWGYSYIRLRGIDQTRINLTLDGIPLNDPEDEVFYFADLPDFASSLQSIQIQRGVGTSTNGTASYGGSINFESVSLTGAPRGAEVQVGTGAWNTRRGSLQYASGLLPSRLAFYVRASDQTTDGYREHSGNIAHSAFLSAGYFGDRDIIKLTATAGLSRNTLAYLASPESTLARDRRDNPLSPQEGDKFGEQVASAGYTRLLNDASSFTTALYGVSATGYYDVKSASELDSYHLDFWWTGLTSAYTYHGEHARLDAGVHAADYHRDHYQYVRPDLSARVYSNRGIKRDASAFVKGGYDLGALSLFGDVQLRDAWWDYVPDRTADIAARRVSWTFLNPKGGASYRLTPALSAYASYGVNGREPARNDMLAGFDNLDTSNVAFVGAPDRVRPETVRDFEGGIHYAAAPLSLDANVYDMQFHNEIAPIGELSYIGLPLRKNVPSSARRGAEMDLTWRAMPGVVASLNGAWSHNRIEQYTDDASGTTYHDVPPLLAPELTSNQRVAWSVGRDVTLSLQGQYTARSFLDNTGDARFVLPSAYIADVVLAWTAGQYGVTVYMNNIADARRFGSGYDDGSVSYYYPMPTRNVYLVFRARF